jgi:hypothetical protein
MGKNSQRIKACFCLGQSVFLNLKPGIVYEASHQLKEPCWVPVAHTCKPSYSGGRNQEDHGSKQPGQIVCETLSRKKPIKKKRAGRVPQGIDRLQAPEQEKKRL